MTGSTSTPRPTAVRRLDSPVAGALADLAAIFDDLQTVLRCCERLLAELATPDPDDLAVEALLTTAVLSYARCFTPGDRGMGLTLEDVTGTGLAGDLAGWHAVLGRLREHYADPGINPRERFSVGASQGADGGPAGIAVTSVRQPLVDDVTVRQTGALAYALTRLVDGRIAEQQERVFTALGPVSAADLEQLPLVELA